MEKTLSLQRKVKSALIYPSVVITMAIIITTVLLVKVVPTFSGIYDSFDQELPAMTQFLVNFSHSLKRFLPLYIGAIIAASFALRLWHGTEKGALILDGIILKLPILGNLLRKVAISRFSRTLATLLQSGVPILESLDIVEKTTGNRVLELVIVDVKTNVREGEIGRASCR